MLKRVLDTNKRKRPVSQDKKKDAETDSGNEENFHEEYQYINLWVLVNQAFSDI